MSVARQHNIGAYVKIVPAVGSTSPVLISSGAGAPNAVEIAGRIIDRLAFPRRYYSAVMAAPFTAQTTGLNANTIGIGMRMMHATSTNSIDFTNLGSSGVVRTFGTTTTSTSINGTASYDVDLRMARRYLQPMFTPNVGVSSSGSYLLFSPVLVFGGADELSSGDTATVVGS